MIVTIIVLVMIVISWLFLLGVWLYNKKKGGKKNDDK